MLNDPEAHTTAPPTELHGGPEEAKSGHPRLPYGTAEEDHDYNGVIAEFADRWRIINCRNSIQWILQSRNTVTRARNRNGKVTQPQYRWRSRGFCRTREGLDRFVRWAIGPDLPDDVKAVLSNLPAYHPGT